jgi:hypothetical protein
VGLHVAEAEFGQTRVRWLGGGLYLEHAGDGFVLDTPPGVVAALGDDALGRIRAIVLTGGRIRTVGGLLELLCALAPHRRGAPLELRGPLGEERGPALAETWVRGWGSPYPLTIDAERPGAVLSVGPMEVELHEVRAGEPDWADETVVRRMQVALRVRTPDATVAWVPGAAPGRTVAQVCDGVDLAVVEIGSEPWPRTDHPWRMSPGEAIRAGQLARQLWMVQDDGTWPGAEA